MLNNLYDEMQKQNVTMLDVATLLGVRYQTVSDKIHGRSDFSFNQAMLIRGRFFPKEKLEYLFKASRDKQPV
jgi:plasmid maintenance system antidote protein VapI